ncbi:MAG: YidC/Oxa1 family membrane protein insertase [Microthrixaceae bacterium]|nr:YidC/Oxa1 family membrane protein insertase [Microthrixaceae bacterium]MCO5311508.1 YidC/Oxa1 family membrane protein insertase [Microthrixaceae bacterium]
MFSAIVAAGAFDGFYGILAEFLNLLYSFTNSYGGAIIVLTIVVMVVTAPLTLKSTRSMLEMQRHQPELRRLQAKYKDDKEKLNTEMMAFYKENNINPLSGCVPMLIQAPVFILLYGTLRGVGVRDGGTVSAIGRAAGQLATDTSFVPWRLTDQVFRPDHLDSSAKLYQTFHSRTDMNFFGVDLAISPIQSLSLGILKSLPFIVLIILMFVIQVIQNRQIQGRNKSGDVNPQQQMMMKIMPFFLPIFSLGLPAGLSLYYFVQGLCRIGLQSYITKQVYEPHHARLESEKDSSKNATVDTTATAKKSAKADKPKSDIPKSAKAQALQKKAASGGSAPAGRKSGAPRSGGPSRSQSGSSKNKKG